MLPYRLDDQPVSPKAAYSANMHLMCMASLGPWSEVELAPKELKTWVSGCGPPPLIYKVQHDNCWIITFLATVLSSSSIMFLLSKIHTASSTDFFQLPWLHLSFLLVFLLFFFANKLCASFSGTLGGLSLCLQFIVSASLVI